MSGDFGRYLDEKAKREALEAENERLREAQLTPEEAAYLLKFGAWPWADDPDGLEASILAKLHAQVDDNSAR